MWGSVYYKLTTRQCRLYLRRWSALLSFALACVLLVLACALAPGPGPSPRRETVMQASAAEGKGAEQSGAGRPVALAAVAADEHPAGPEAPEQSAAGGGPGSAPAAAAAAAVAVVAAPANEKLKQPPQLPARPALLAKVHPKYHELIREYPFQPVRNDKGKFVNVILVRAPFSQGTHDKMYKKYKDQILFLGFSSFETFPWPSPNPFSGNFPEDKYVGLFPGFLHMVRDPEKVFPSHVKTLLMSQSDFSLPHDEPWTGPKKYDFTFSGSDQDVGNNCVGWASFAKNWSFVHEALKVMCKMDMKGVLVATKDKQGKKACKIPPECEGKMTQTSYIDQGKFFSYAKQSKFVLLPQIFDASPRVSTQALSLDLPILMNRNIKGGWKYVNEKTGEFFNDMDDFPAALKRLYAGIEAKQYSPREWVFKHFDDPNSGKRLRQFVEEHFSDRVRLPGGTKMLFPSGA